MRVMRRTWSYIVLLWVALLPMACSTIDDDLSDCPPPPEPEEGQDYELSYEMRLVTNITTEINTQLNTTTDVNVANALRSYLKDIFTDYAKDVDLSFYDTENAQERLSHDQHVMNGSEQSYTLYLPMREYMHLAVANVKDNSAVELRDDDYCPSSRLLVLPGVKDTIDSHTTGLFTARQPMEVVEGVDQTFHVRLYMANCAAALIVDPRGQDASKLKVFTTGFASQFQISDSTYSFAQSSPIVRMTKLDTDADELCFCSVNFPSPEPQFNRTVIETEDPFVSESTEEALWQFRAYVSQPDGTVTESLLSVKEPLRAGQLKIIKAYMDDNGAVRTDDTEVGVSVTLDWKEGGQHDIGI